MPCRACSLGADDRRSRACLARPRLTRHRRAPVVRSARPTVADRRRAVHRHALPERGGDARLLHRGGARLPQPAGRERRDRGRRQRQHGRLTADRRRLRRPRRRRPGSRGTGRRCRPASRPRAAGTSSWATPTPATTSRTSRHSSIGCAAGTTWWSATASPVASSPAPCRRCIATWATRCSPTWAGASTAARSVTSTVGCAGSTRAAIEGLGLRTTGMEFASEMVVKAALGGLTVTEVPTTLRPDGRSRPAHLRPWRDGWRHLRFLLLYSPRWLFLYPGIALISIGLLVMAWLLPGPRTVGHVVLDTQTLLYAGGAVVLGYDAVLFAVFSKVFAVTAGLLPASPWLDRALGRVTLEVGLRRRRRPRPGRPRRHRRRRGAVELPGLRTARLLDEHAGRGAGPGRPDARRRDRAGELLPQRARHPAPVTRRRTLVVAGLAAVTILSTILRLLVPLWVIGDAVEDDQLFVRLGSSLREGAWLGPFDTRTLQKGPAFPAFLAAAQLTRLPYLLAVHLVHLLACAAAAAAIGRAAGSRSIGCWLYVVLALDPSFYGWGASRVLRDNWYSSVCLLLFALAALALPGSGSGGRSGRGPVGPARAGGCRRRRAARRLLAHQGRAAVAAARDRGRCWRRRWSSVTTGCGRRGRGVAGWSPPDLSPAAPPSPSPSWPSRPGVSRRRTGGRTGCRSPTTSPAVSSPACTAPGRACTRVRPAGTSRSAGPSASPSTG